MRFKGGILGLKWYYNSPGLKRAILLGINYYIALQKTQVLAKLNPNIKIDLYNTENTDTSSLSAKILAGDRYALSKGITLIESEAKKDKEDASALLDNILRSKSDSFRIGISGAPGVGKSTLIEALGNLLIKKAKKPAILAIDPSSNSSRGSILADKTRMDRLSQSDFAFIRPSPAGTSLGGVARKTRESIFLTEAAGFDPVIIETVGVGQSETAVHSMTDLFILIIAPGGGDEIQGIKRGIMELADIVVINKMDGKLKDQAAETESYYSKAISLFRQKENGWRTRLVSVSALEQTGIENLWKIIDEFKSFVIDNKHYFNNKTKQNLKWFEDHFNRNLLQILISNPVLKTKYNMAVKSVISGKTSPFKAANEVLDFIESKFIE